MQGNVGLSSAVLPVTVKVWPATATATRRSIKMPACRVRAGADAGAGAGAMATAAEVDYSSNVSVFPMEACELIGGEACEAQMYPEAKLGTTTAGARGRVAVAEEVEREYLPYDGQKTVFPGEACDDLGGEFCEAPYQMGVSNEESSIHA